MHAVKWFGGALVTLGFSAITVMLGANLLPSGAVAQKKGTYVPWVLTWGLLWGTALAGVIVALFMVMYGTGKVRSE